MCYFKTPIWPTKRRSKDKTYWLYRLPMYGFLIIFHGAFFIGGILFQGHFCQRHNFFKASFFLGAIFSWAFFHVLKAYFVKAFLRGIFSWLAFYQGVFFSKRKYFLQFLFPGGIFPVEIFPGVFCWKAFSRGILFQKALYVGGIFPGIFLGGICPVGFFLGGIFCKRFLFRRFF